MSNEIQQLIDQVSAGGVLKLTPAKREFEGPAVIRNPMTIEGQGCTLWAETGPVLSIEADRVSISSLNIEATGPDDQEGPGACAINVADQNKVVLKDVAVRGNVIGVAKEEGQWRYPRSIRLGRLQPDQPHNFTAKFVAPAPCEFHSDIAGLSIQPRSSSGGAVKLLLIIDPLKPGTILRGVIRIKTGSLTRTINVNANAPVHVLGNETVGSGQDVYAPDDWQTMYKDDDGEAASETPPPVKQPSVQKPPKQPSPPQPAQQSVSIPPPPPKKQKEKKKKPKPSGPQVNLPDRLESAPAPTPSQKAKPGAFDPPKPPTPTKPLPDDDTTPSSDSKKRSKRRAPKMDSSLFGSKPKPADNTPQSNEAETSESDTAADPPELSQPSVVPPPPPRKNPPAEKKEKPKSQSVVPPPPSKQKSADKDTKTPAPEMKAESNDSNDKKKSGRQKPSGLGGAFG